MKVKGYTRKLGGKTVKVKGYTRKSGSSKHTVGPHAGEYKHKHGPHSTRGATARRRHNANVRKRKGLDY